MSYALPKGKKGHASVAIVTIIDEEFDAVRNVLGIDEELEGTPYFVTRGHDDKIWDVVLVQSLDRSTLPCGALVGEVIEDFRPQVLLLVGIAGAVCEGNRGREGIGLGDVVIADSVGYVEFLKITDKRVFLRHYAVDQPSLHLRGVVIQPLVRKFKLQEAITLELPEPVPEHEIHPRIFIGQIVSGEKVLGGVENAIQSGLLEPFDKALAVDMESIGMARMVCERRTTFWYNPRYAVIRGISDLVGIEGNNKTREKWKLFAAHAAATVAQEFVRRLALT